jgi:hypothetical protein
MFNEKLEFVFQMAKYTDVSLPTCKKIMRLGATHNRIETELTNGYKDRAGNWDIDRTVAAKKKRDRIGNRLESLLAEHGLSVEYGALTVRVLLPNNREVYIP